MSRLTVIQNQIAREVKFIGNPLLSEVLENAGYVLPHPCGGRGVCAKCKVLINGSSELSCQYRLTDGEDITVTLPDSEELKQIELSGHGEITFDDPMPGQFGTAIDIGTTTVAMKTYNLVTGELINETGFINPQTTVAADVMGRIKSALEGKSELLQSQICGAIEDAFDENEIDPDAMVITGNTTMLYLLAGMNPDSLSHAPFEADCLFDVRMNFGPTIAYLPPCMHAFVGADISTAVLSSGMCESDEISLLCDIGTNGEIALWKDGILYVSSTAAGPAFEGAGISCGCMGVSGAIDNVSVENGKLKIHTIDDEKAIGICGSGLIDAIAAGLDMGIIEDTGSMDEDEFILADGVSINAKDISQVQLAKSAIAAGIATMMTEAHIRPDDVKKIYIAGGFGSHLNTDSAIRIGLIPEEFRDSITVLGNAALTGACQLLGDMEKIDAIRKIASTSSHVNLGGNPMFNSLYVENMLFPE
ncbi:MAG: ASKHA domain-containing protein [Lachnospiraceae bacterium]|nr:ASKHA domain-containing protein [Lachnospiraceae bacterium]